MYFLNICSGKKREIICKKYAFLLQIHLAFQQFPQDIVSMKSIVLQMAVSLHCSKSAVTMCQQYIYQDSKRLEPVAYFAEPDLTSLWAVWGRATCTVHLISAPDKPGRKNKYKTMLDKLRTFCPNIYFLYVLFTYLKFASHSIAGHKPEKKNAQRCTDWIFKPRLQLRLPCGYLSTKL